MEKNLISRPRAPGFQEVAAIGASGSTVRAKVSALGLIPKTLPKELNCVSGRQTGLSPRQAFSPSGPLHASPSRARRLLASQSLYSLGVCLLFETFLTRLQAKVHKLQGKHKSFSAITREGALAAPADTENRVFSGLTAESAPVAGGCGLRRRARMTARPRCLGLSQLSLSGG